MRRKLILNIIKNEPGISYNEIVRETKLSNGVVSHYLIQLIDNDEIIKYGKPRSKYFIKNIGEKDMNTIVMLRNQTNNDICKILLKNSENGLKLAYRTNMLDATEIAKMIKKSKSTISVSLRILQERNMIERVIMNKKSKLTSDIGYVILNRDYWLQFLTKYKL